VMGDLGKNGEFAWGARDRRPSVVHSAIEVKPLRLGGILRGIRCDAFSPVVTRKVSKLPLSEGGSC
jgi:hypothetical protein